MNNNNQTITQKMDAKNKKRDFIYAIGRRREAVARVRLYEHIKDDLSWNDTPVKKGDILVNGKLITEVFGDAIRRHIYAEPFRVTNTANRYAITVKVDGGGLNGQLQAIVHGISQALALVEDKKHRTVLKTKGFLTRDARVRERRKVGTGGKARRAKQSPKR